MNTLTIEDIIDNLEKTLITLPPAPPTLHKMYMQGKIDTLFELILINEDDRARLTIEYGL